MIRQSETITKIAAALAKAYAAVENVSLDSTNPHFKNKYAGLPGVLDEVRAKLLKEGILLMQFPDMGYAGAAAAVDTSLYLTTRLQHESGEFYEATAVVPLPKADPQGFGSAMTYARRYAALSIFGLVGEADDDGNGASNGGGNARPTQAPREAPTRPAPTGGVKFGSKPSAPPAKTGGAVFGGKKAETAKAKAGIFPTPAAKTSGELVDRQPPIDRPEGDEEQADET